MSTYYMPGTVPAARGYRNGQDYLLALGLLALTAPSKLRTFMEGRAYLHYAGKTPGTFQPCAHWSGPCPQILAFQRRTSERKKGNLLRRSPAHATLSVGFLLRSPSPGRPSLLSPSPSQRPLLPGVATQPR